MPPAAQHRLLDHVLCGVEIAIDQRQDEADEGPPVGGHPGLRPVTTPRCGHEGLYAATPACVHRIGTSGTWPRPGGRTGIVSSRRPPADSMRTEVSRPGG